MSRKRKNSIFLFIAVMLIALIGGISTAVYSSTESKVVVKLSDERVWECKNEFLNNWYTNIKENSDGTNKKISFQVDLGDHSKSENLPEPFTVKIGNGNSLDNTISDITCNSNVNVAKVTGQPGVFEVTFEASRDIISGDFINIDLNFKNDNKWNTKDETKTFRLKVDNTDPELDTRNIVCFTSDSIKLDITEENLDKVVINGRFKGSYNSEFEPINNEVLSLENGTAAGKFSFIKKGETDGKYNLLFNEIGAYEINLTLYDKAGNNVTFSDIKFQRTKSDFRFKMENVKQYDNDETYYVSGKELKVNIIWNICEREEVSYRMAKEGETNNGNYTGLNCNNRVIVAPEDGIYNIEFHIIKWKAFSWQKEELKLHYKLKFDSENPKISIKADEEEVNFDNNHQVFFQDSKDIQISLTDTNINECTREIDVFKGWDLIKSTRDESLNFNAEDEGLYVIKATAEDYSGNNINETYFINIDKTNPNLILSGVENGQKFKKGDNETPTIRLKAYDDNFEDGEVIITREDKDGQVETTKEPLNNGEEFIYEVDKNGKYTLTAKAVDKANRTANIDENKQPIKFERDVDAPKLDIKVDDRELGWCEFNEDNMPYLNNENGISIDTTVDEDYPKLKDDGTVDEKATYMKVERTPVDQEGNPQDTEESYEYFLDDNNNVVNRKILNIDKDGKYKVTIYSIDNCGNESERTLYFILDRQAPELSVTDVNGYHNNIPNIQVESKDAFQEGGHIIIKYTKIVRHLWQADEVCENQEVIKDITSADEVINLSELDEFKDQAEYRIPLIQAYDRAGNASEPKSLDYTFDTEAPTKSIEGFEDKGFYNSEVTVSMNTEDINLGEVDFKVYKNGEIYNPTEEEVVQAFTREERKAYATYKFDSDGEYEFRLTSVDKAGNGEKLEDGSEDVLVKSFVIDKTAPAIEIEDFDSLNGKYINYDKALKVNINDMNLKDEVESTYVRITKKRPGEEAVTTDYKFELNGECPNYSNIYDEFTEDADYTVVVVATDKSNNVTTSPTLTFTVDKTVPVQTITGVENDAYYNVDKDVELLSIDNNQDINTAVVTRDGEEYHVGEFTIEGIKAFLKETFSGEGTYEIVFTTTDKAGNTAVSTVKFTIDKTAPDIKAIKGDDGSEIKFGEYINRIFTPQFVLDKSEDFITQVTLNGADVTGNVSMASQEMEYNYTVTAQDKAGNVTTIDSSFTVDTTNPAISISGIMSGFFNEDITPEFDITDTNLDYANTSSTLNEQPFTSGTKIEDQNDFNLKLIGTDLATNSNSQSISFTIDKDGPVIKFENPISGKYFTEDFIPKFLIEDLSDYTIIALTLDGEEYHIGDVIEEEGKHVLYIEVMDKAGNISELSIEFILDKTAPKFIIDGVADGETYYDAMSATVMLDNPLDSINGITVNGEAANGEVSDEFGQQVVKLKFNDINDYEVVLKGTDEAGNSTVQTVKFAVAEKTLLSNVTTNKKLLYSSVAAAAAVAVMGTTGIVLKRRSRLKVAENVEDEE